jgi:hypothetical protein
MGMRAHQPVEDVIVKVADEDKKLGLNWARNNNTDTGPKKPEPSKPWSRFRRGGGGGGSSFAQDIYSRPAYSLNADKPAGLYTKVPSYTRFDYLRPSVATKGSREAYRREDF